MLYRVFPWDSSASEESPGGPRFNPRNQQGSGRHDNPDVYGVIYVSRVEVSAVSEWLAPFRGQTLESMDLERTDGRQLALVGLDESTIGNLVDLDDPTELLDRTLRPSGVATYDRKRTQRIARALFDEGIAGFGWWSTMEAGWPNVTLFAERAVGRLRVSEGPRRLTLVDPAVIAAASSIGVAIA